MRKLNSFLTCMALGAATLCALSVSAQPTTGIFGATDKSWQYYQAGNEPAPSGNITWRTNTYNDAAWQSGFGIFAYEDGGAYPVINTVLDRTVGNVPGGTTNITYYFRTHFNFPTTPAGAILYFTNYVDDGLILYLNGVRLYDIRVATANPTWATYAGGGPPTEGAPELRTFVNSPLLRQGDNVLAVELHDGGLGSSDVAFGLGLGYSIMDPIVITQQPQSIDAVAFDEVELKVEAEGTTPRYWWFRNNVFIANQTNANLRLNNIQISQAGTYHVIVSNIVSGVRSSNAVVRVVPDTFGPRLLSACVQDTNRLLLQFSEDIMRFPGVAATNRSGTYTSNYWITVIGQPNTRLVVTQAVVGVANAQVRLQINTNFNFNTNYQICISNITDVRTNVIAWNSCVPVCFEVATNVYDYRSPWFYSEGFNLDSENWTGTNYVENSSQWFEWTGMFAVEQSGLVNPPCSSISWTMSLGPNAYYFRKKFVLTTNVLASTNITATFGTVVDDGAVVYLNGTELFRINMPNGPITYDTRAPAAGNPNVCNVNTLAVGHLLRRTNVVAVEVHQNGDSVIGTDRRAAFDGSFSLGYEKYPTFTQPTNIRVRMTNHSPTQVAVYFTNGLGYAIQSKTNLSDPWQEVQPATNRLIVPKTDKQRFFRLRKSH